jgi:ArsR family transcriptional regulator
MEELCETPYRLNDKAKKALIKIKKKDYGNSSALFKSLSDTARLKIIDALGVDELCVCVLVEVTGLQYSALSYHLKMLKDSGLISSYKDGNFLIYSLTEDGKKVNELLNS